MGSGPSKLGTMNGGFAEPCLTRLGYVADMKADGCKERTVGFEPTTLCLASRHSTTVLHTFDLAA